MKQGEVETAVRRAYNLFDEWNDITGFPEKHTSYYFEIQSLIEDAVHCGIQAALKIKEPIGSEKERAKDMQTRKNADVHIPILKTASKIMNGK